MTEEQRRHFVECLANTERLDKLEIILDPNSMNVMVIWRDMDMDDFQTLASLANVTDSD